MNVLQNILIKWFSCLGFLVLFSLLHCLTSHPKFDGLKQQPFNVSHGSVGWLGLAGKFCSSPLVLYMVPDRWLSELEWFRASNVILGWPGFFAFHAFSKTLLLHEPYLFSPTGLSSRVTRFLCSGSGIPKCQKQKLSILFLMPRFFRPGTFFYHLQLVNSSHRPVHIQCGEGLHSFYVRTEH